jgi:hypothetical protein
LLGWNSATADGGHFAKRFGCVHIDDHIELRGLPDRKAVLDLVRQAREQVQAGWRESKSARCSTPGSTIMERLTKLSPNNSVWKRDLIWFDKLIVELAPTDH